MPSIIPRVTTPESDAVSARAHEARRASRRVRRGRRAPADSEQPERRRVSVVGIVGELFITAGVFVFLFLGWQLWLNDIVVGNEQNSAALEFGRELGAAAPPAGQRPDPADAADYGDPVITAVAEEETRFANLYVPRFGADYVRTIAEGVGEDDVLRSGIGHYPETQMPGEVGNFAIAAHRTTFGAPFNRIAELQVGDRIYVQTADGWYIYVFRSTEYVAPTGVEVLAPVPQQPEALATERVLTMTSCNPMFSAAERIIAYAVYDSWQPASAGPPAEIADLVERIA